MTIPFPRPADQVREELIALLPDGAATPHDFDNYWSARLSAPAAEIALIEESAFSMLPQIDPRQAPDLLPDWEQMLGPDPCQVSDQVTDTVTRGQIAYQRLTNRGTICAGYFERYALSIGETITIEEFPAYMLGLAVCGGSMLVQPPEHCSFQVSLPARDVVYFICGASQCGDALGSFQPSVMECVIRNGAPLYATPYFNYTS
jgi:uncharacterized protein YmfQ (DUF2313 family)